MRSRTPKRRPIRWRDLLAATSISLALHSGLLLVLSWIVFRLPDPLPLTTWVLSGATENRPEESLDMDSVQVSRSVMDVEARDGRQDDVDAVDVAAVVVPDLQQVPARKTRGAPESLTSASFKTDDSWEKNEYERNPKLAVKAPHADHFLGRAAGMRDAMVQRMGGTKASQEAVVRGLDWLERHQVANGAWNYNHARTIKDEKSVVQSTHSHNFNPECDCTMPGWLDDGDATGLVLLAFLGAGQTHLEGDYQPEVQRGLDFLLYDDCIPSIRPQLQEGFLFTGGVKSGAPYAPVFLSGAQLSALKEPPPVPAQLVRYCRNGYHYHLQYTHALATTALGETFAMTRDRRLPRIVDGAVQQLIYLQRPDGGWGFTMGASHTFDTPSNTSLLIWQVIALKSTQFARFKVPESVYRKINGFLDSVSSQKGSQYAYAARQRASPAMTAAGLLCRMYVDGKPDDERIRAGIRYLDDKGFDPNDMYYNFLATQVMFHWGGPEWDRWNPAMREHLISTQIRTGHAAGSWDVADRHGNLGGRMYMTTLALLTLEVYYRHLPLNHRERMEIPLRDVPEVAGNNAAE